MSSFTPKRAAGSADPRVEEPCLDLICNEDAEDLVKVKPTTRSFQCDVCAVMYSLEWHLQRHMRTKHGESSYSSETKPIFNSLHAETVKQLENSSSAVGLKENPSGVQAMKLENSDAESVKPAENPFVVASMKPEGIQTNRRRFACKKCTRSFVSKLALSRHKGLVHCAKTTHTREACGTFACDQCTLTFARKAQVSGHKKLAHDDEFASPKNFICGVCRRGFKHKTSVALHMERKHNLQRQSKLNLKCSIVDCSFLCRNMKDLMEHLNSAHEQKLSFETLNFVSEEEFKEWLRKVQNDVPCVFQKRQVRSKRMYYYCSRTGSYKPTISNRKRQLKMQGSSKIGRTCPAHLNVCCNADGSLTVNYVSKHFCHTDPHEQLGHLKLSYEDRKYIAEQLANNVPLNVILENIRRGVEPNGKLRRIHLITKKDLHNVRQEFNLDRQECRHRDTDKEFLHLIGTCKGRYTKKISVARRGHQESLTMTVQAEQVSEYEWVLSSESTNDAYVVRWENLSCTRVKCKVVCQECDVCVHMFTCTCPENAVSSNLCKHIHYVRRQFSTNARETASEVEVHENLPVAHSDESEASPLVTQIGLPSTSLEPLQQRVRDLIAEMMTLADAVQTHEQLLCMEEYLEAIKAKVEALRCKGPQPSITTSASSGEPRTSVTEPIRVVLVPKSKIAAPSTHQPCIASVSQPRSFIGDTQPKRRFVLITRSNVSTPIGTLRQNAAPIIGPRYFTGLAQPRSHPDATQPKRFVFVTQSGCLAHVDQHVGVTSFAQPRMVMGVTQPTNFATQLRGLASSAQPRSFADVTHMGGDIGGCGGFETAQYEWGI